MDLRHKELAVLVAPQNSTNPATKVRQASCRPPHTAPGFGGRVKRSPSKLSGPSAPLPTDRCREPPRHHRRLLSETSANGGFGGAAYVSNGFHTTFEPYEYVEGGRE